MSKVIWSQADASVATLVLGHGAGAPMDSPFMEQISGYLTNQSITVARFEFDYMAQRRTGGSKRPPPKAERLIASFAGILAEIGPQATTPIFIGGKSMSGRIAAMLAGDPETAKSARGVVCLGYPLHPIGKPEQLRLDPLTKAGLPILICQGDRDEFGNRAEFERVSLPQQVEITWLEDGNHDFGPRGRSPATKKGNLEQAARSTRAFIDRVLAG